MKANIQPFIEKIFGSEHDSIGYEVEKDLINIIRHIVQNKKTAPNFIEFAEREKYDLDVVAKELIDKTSIEQFKHL
ncbi:MAG: hypothetical protein ABRQ39_16890 [Candidatus Eremiobacterota bacterium]